jgi:hypothetical protein
VLAFIRYACPASIVFAVPNGGARSATEAAILIGQGVLPGAPDLVLIVEGGHVLLIELKAPKGRITEAQVAFRNRCWGLDIPYAVCRSVDDIEAFLRDCGVPMRVRQSA